MLADGGAEDGGTRSTTPRGRVRGHSSIPQDSGRGEEEASFSSLRPEKPSRGDEWKKELFLADLKGFKSAFLPAAVVDVDCVRKSRLPLSSLLISTDGFCLCDCSFTIYVNQIDVVYPL